MGNYEKEMFEYAFEDFWRYYWKENTMPEVLNQAWKEVARDAWNAAIEKAEKLYTEVDSGDMAYGEAVNLLSSMKT